MIPQVEHLHLPGPPWLFVALTVLTLSLHLVCVFFVLGGSFLASLLEGLGVVFRRQRLRDAARLLTPVLPLALSAGITLGVAPLLFIQALYPQFFYPATVLRGYWWLAVVFVLIVAFYLLYLGQSEQAKGWRNLTSAIIVRLAFIGFLYVALMYTLVSQLETHPAEWGSFVNGGLRF